MVKQTNADDLALEPLSSSEGEALSLTKPQPISQTKTKSSKSTNPIVILMAILLFAMSLTYFIDSGEYQREGKVVIAGSFTTLEKSSNAAQLFSVTNTEDVTAVSLPQTLMSIPEGLEKASGLIFMVLIIGGVFGIMSRSGAIDAGLERLMSMVNGNIYVLVFCLMFLFSAGSTFLGLASEYLIIIPLMVAMAERIGLSRVIGFAIVTVSVKAGYLSSVTNPLPLTIAQPLLGLPIFSGAGVRFWFFIIFTLIGIAFVMWTIRASQPKENSFEFSSAKLSFRHCALLSILVLSIAILVYASNQWHWKHNTISAYYIGVSLLIALFSGLGASGAADAFVTGMKKVLLASFLIGVATAVAITLQKGMILDTIVNALMGLIGESGPTVSAIGMFVSQLLLDFLIPSTSGQAAVSMPILGPIGQLSGVPPQTTVIAFLFGNGITNIITPTSGTLLAYLATAKVGWLEWAKYILPLWFAFIITAIILLAVCVQIGF